ncbi:hypothetical protein DFR29_1418 [Tahibacter aquaticus]|uniref:Uncharacterized protein n=1 Tax=Tahibacter aquaticus TaxID=520092 RepID=A0A4R6YFJ8_9GAMM|nr:hypothetical protein [Tahibacter aquaticus]TDR34962.1 hypothetical protein DFR29_1418 [Tahibacter aquaticus]
MIGDITLEHFKPCFQGHNIIDCAVRDRNIFYFIAREDYTSWPDSKWDRENEPPPEDSSLRQHIVGYFRARPMETRWTRTALTGLANLMSGVALQPDPKHLALALDGPVYAMGSGSKGFEAPLRSWREGGPMRGSINKLRTIGGWLYFCGGNNSVGKRLGSGEWLSHTQSIPDPERNDSRDNTLEDIDGFSESDIYTVGSEGQVFHYDGKTWTRLAFPTNARLETVCCAGNGSVYISDVDGSVFKGRGEEWVRIHKTKLQLPYRDMVWHDGKLWCTSDYGVWTIADDKVAVADLPPGVAAYAGNLSAADGVLLLAGYGGAAFREDGHWTVLYSAVEMHRAARSNVS